MFRVRTCVAPICTKPGWTRPTFEKHVSAAPSWEKPRCAERTCGGAYLRLARLDGADLSGADLRDVEGLAQKQIDVAVCDQQTKLPDGFQIRAHDGG